MVMIHGYDARLKTYTYNTCLGRGKPHVLSYLDAAAEEEAWLAAFVQLGKSKWDSCLPMLGVQSRHKSSSCG